jgi:very-short-patch-repair endonuclease
VLGQRAKLRVSGSRDARVAAIAALQRGRVARRQLLAGGLSGGQVRGLVGGDRLFREHAGVYAVGHPGPVPLGAETAALLAAPEGALLSHRSAAALWGLSGIASADGCVDVLVVPPAQMRRAGIRVHRSRYAALAEPRVRDGLPVTSPAHLMLDLATELGDRAFARVHDEALVLGILTPRDCERALARLAGHPGAGRLRALIEGADAGVTESEAERLLESLLAQTDLPPSQHNRWVAGYRLDCFWAQARFAVEVDGYRFHSGRRRFERDRVRDTRLAAAEVEVMRVTWRQLSREPLAVIARIAAALTRRTPSDR